MLRRAWLWLLSLTAACSGYGPKGFTQSRSGYETKWFTQSLTHVRGDSRTFAQRYLVESYVGRGTAPLPGPAPVLFYAGKKAPSMAFGPALDSYNI